MPPTEALPDSVGRRLNELNTAEQVDWSLASDLTADGRFGERWLVVADGRVLVISPEDDQPISGWTRSQP
jgi:hypothetical protein